jgi:hypothetical protein
MMSIVNEQENVLKKIQVSVRDLSSNTLPSTVEGKSDSLVELLVSVRDHYRLKEWKFSNLFSE